MSGSIHAGWAWNTAVSLARAGTDRCNSGSMQASTTLGGPAAATVSSVEALSRRPRASTAAMTNTSALTATPTHTVRLSPSAGNRANAATDRAADRAGGVDGIEQRDPRSYFPIGAHGVADQQRQRGAHEGRGDGEHHKRHEQVEDGLADGGRVRRRRLVAEHRRVERPGSEQQQWNGQRRKGNPCLEHAVRQHRAGDTSGVAPGNGRAQCQAAHVGSQHRGDRQLARPEYQRELPEPRGLVQKCGENPKGKSRRRPRHTRAKVPAPTAEGEAARLQARQTGCRYGGARLPGAHRRVSRPSVVFGAYATPMSRILREFGPLS